jgi:murein DD-endopeptidase MepM/ murein hydrolase activator NlpD
MVMSPLTPSSKGEVTSSSHLLSPPLAETSPALFTYVSDTKEVPAEEEKKEEGASVAIHKIKSQKRDSLKNILLKVGIPKESIAQASQALLKLYPQKEVASGLEITFKKHKGQFKELSFSPDFGEEIRLISHEKGKFSGQKLHLKVKKKLECMGGRINSSLYNDALKAGVPIPIVKQMINVLSHAVDFDELQKGDVFEVMYNGMQDGSHRKKFGELSYAAVTVGGEPMRVYLFKKPNGDLSYYHEDGSCVQKGLLRTPVDSAVTSKFGPRLHPVLKYTRMHTGVDFGASPGTRVMSAGDGVIIHAAWKGSYGNCVVIRHNNEFTTLYAHLKKFSPKIRRGARVKQGDVIGYVGSTGLCSGPHLHHEVWKYGKPINPAKVHHLSGSKLTGKPLRRLKSHIRSVDLQFAARPNGSLIASLQKTRVG